MRDRLYLTVQWLLDVQLLPERDGATRAAALGTIEMAWVEEGDNIWKLLGR